MEKESIGIVGAGNSAHALAAYMASQGHRVSIFARDPARIRRIAETGRIEAVGKLDGSFPIDLVTGEPGEMVKRSRVIFLATVTTAYAEVARALAPHLEAGQVVVPFSSKLCGSLEVARALDDAGATGIHVIETDALFACRIQDDGAIWVRGFKGWNLYSCQTRSETLEFGGLLTRFFPGLEPAVNLVHRGLTDFGALAHAVIMLANISRIDRKDEFLFYYEGLSERTVVLLEQMEREFRAVAKAYEVDLIPMKDLLSRYYGCDTSNLLTAMTSVPNYRHSVAPTTLEHRFLQEDVACTLVPLRELARLAAVETPMVDAVINLASILSKVDLKDKGRHLGRLGLADKSHKEVLRWMQS